MGEKDLADRWIKLCESFALNEAEEWEAMIERYGAADRAYHNLAHIADCLHQLDLHAGLAEDRNALEFAIWFHDVIYDSRAHDNELKSAEAASRFLGETSISEKVTELILATRHEARADDGDQQLMADIDLSILGRGRAGYETYAAAIRAEYAWVPEDDYVRGRSKVLGGFLDRSTIFSLAVFRERYENQARINIRGELDSLSG